LVKEQVRDIHDLTSVWSGERVKAATAKPDAKGGEQSFAAVSTNVRNVPLRVVRIMTDTKSRAC
jgi:hypothetical protein